MNAGIASTRNYLYHNERDGTFRLADDADMPKIPSQQHSAVWGDYDNDGDPDLLVSAGNPGFYHNVLYRNDGGGTLTGITSGAIYGDTGVGFHFARWADYDNDGFIDLLIAGHDSRPHLYHNRGDGSFTRITNSILVSELAPSVATRFVVTQETGRSSRIKRAPIGRYGRSPPPGGGGGAASSRLIELPSRNHKDLVKHVGRRSLRSVERPQFGATYEGSDDEFKLHHQTHRCDWPVYCGRDPGTRTVCMGAGQDADATDRRLVVGSGIV